MNQSNQTQSSSGAYPSPPVSTGPYMAPPPLGYPTNDTSHVTAAPVEAKPKGDGFFKACIAALCCCWICENCL